MNSINIIGRLTADPELRYLPGENSVAVCKFSVAVRRNKETTDFFNCTAWAGTAEMLEKYFLKGHLIGVTGSMEQESWTDKQGNKRTSWTLNARSVYFCDSGRDPKEDPEPEPEPEKPKARYTRR